MEVQTEILGLLKKHENSYINQLLLSLPAGYIRMSSSHSNNYEQIISAIQLMCKSHKADQDVDDFFREVGVDKKNWSKLDNFEEKYKFILKNLEKSIEDHRKKVNVQLDNYLVHSRKSITPANKENKPKDPFDWLKLKNKYPMCQQKLKAKLVQAISDSKNQKRIRDRIANPNSVPKVSLLDESLILDEYQKIKIDYSWTEEDESVLIGNINALKQKFNHTEFLKLCQRFRFISAHELQTLAAEEISRKLDQDNKVYLSRQFLLDKYYSTRQFLTEQEMRFILKTSPMLSKCVDKQFIRNAIKNIDYEDINRLELKIAENIIGRFEQIRKAVRQSRKQYKQTKNNKIKEVIVDFQKKQQLEVAREMAREELAKHKTYTKSKSAKNLHLPINGQHKKMFVPLNVYHPPSGLFVKDCNEQCIDDLFNSYETNYIEGESELRKVKARPKQSMFQFYTGGLQVGVPEIPMNVINTICSIIKGHYYERALKTALDNYEVSKTSSLSGRTNKSVKSTLFSQKTTLDLGRRNKSTLKTVQDSSEAAIKRRIIENKEKAKAVIYVNKLLSLAVENNLIGFKALNVKYTAEQVNTKDRKGNTSLFYVSRHGNIEFINQLLNLGADPSITCEKDFTPLHYIFQTNNANLIMKCLSSHKTPNLNAINCQNKTPLAYCSNDVLTQLNLQQGVVMVENRFAEFDNMTLLTRDKNPKTSSMETSFNRGESRANTTQWILGQ